MSKIYNVILDSNNTSSFSGNQFNPTFIVDFKNMITDPNDYNKSYNLTFKFVSSSATYANNGLNNVYNYYLYCSFGKNIHSINSNKITNYIGTINVCQNLGFQGVANPPYPNYFYSLPTDNAPVFVNDITGINSITLNVVNANDGTTFNSANNATINTNCKFICTLTFTPIN